MSNTLVTVSSLLLLLVQVHCQDVLIYKPTGRIREVDNTPEICRLKAETGRCKASMRRFFFNEFTQKCELFIYGGCDGNENNFDSIGECLAKCKANGTRNYCHLDPETGPCRALFQRFYYNYSTKQCETFSYGGCRGNRNNFNSLKSCQKKCQKKRPVPEICQPHLDTGDDCPNSIRRFFYDSFSQKCQLFMYTGCGGNTNNFVKKRTCNQVCRKGKKFPR